jgi:hypothetical protein
LSAALAGQRTTLVGLEHGPALYGTRPKKKTGASKYLSAAPGSTLTRRPNLLIVSFSCNGHFEELPMQARPKIETVRTGEDRDWAAEIERTIRSSRGAPAEPSSAQAVLGTADEWSDTLELVMEATASINAAHERIAELADRNRDLEVTFAAELRALAARVTAAQEDLAAVEARRVAAEQRAERAERRADAAAGWLKRIHDHTGKHVRT